MVVERKNRVQKTRMANRVQKTRLRLSLRLLRQSRQTQNPSNPLSISLNPFKTNPKKTLNPDIKGSSKGLSFFGRILQSHDGVHLGFRLLATEEKGHTCPLYTSPSPRDATLSRMPSSA